METSKEFVTQRTVILEGGQSSGEYVLPDYQGDVKKVLLTRACAVPSGKYKNGDVLDIVGVVTYDVVYIDSEDNITPLSFTTDYDMSLRIDDEMYVDAAVRTTISNFSLRLMGPRKFSAKAQLECECLVAERREYEVEGDTFGRDGAIARCKTVNILSGAYGKSEEREVAEEVAHIDGAIVDEVEVLLCDVECRNITAVGNDSGAEVKAEVCLTLLIKEMGEAPYTAERVLNFVADVPSDAFDEKMALTADVIVLSRRAEVNPVEDGVSIVASVILEAEVAAVGNVPLRVVSDCYSTVCECQNEVCDFPYTEHIGTRCEHERLSVEMPRESVSLEGARNILFTSATAKAASCEVDGNSVKVETIIRFSGIACEVSEDGVVTYAPIRLDVPFSDNVTYDLQIPESAKPRAHVVPTQAHIEIDTASVRPSCSMAIYTSLECERCESCVTSSTLAAEYPEADPSLVRVYYPEAGESLFEVAKRFHVSPHAIAGDNELCAEVFAAQDSPDGLNGIKYLVIK